MRVLFLCNGLAQSFRSNVWLARILIQMWKHIGKKRTQFHLLKDPLQLTSIQLYDIQIYDI